MKMIITSLFLFYSIQSFAVFENDGHWVSNCYEEDGLFVQEEVVFSSSQITFYVIVYRKPECISKLVVSKTSGNYVFAEGSTSPALDLDIVITKSTITPQTLLAAATMNNRITCGMNDWKMGVEKNTSGKICEGENVPNVGDGRFNLFWQDKDNAYFGLKTTQYTGETIDKRPIQLNLEKPYHNFAD